MEDDSRNILSPLLDTPQMKKQFENLEMVIKEGTKRIDYTLANDPDIVKAIEIVERFLRKEKRICYGGQAINALLPKERQFYDTKYMIPDYDFFSPNVLPDSEKLIELLMSEGFKDVSKRMGVHKGTIKIYVNYIAVADITEMHPPIFQILKKRAKVINGILYCDPEFLQMLMYLELSRPRGQIDRWIKVYERLVLLNNAYPVSSCHQTIIVPHVNYDERATILDFCVKHKRVVVSPEMIELFEKGESKKYMESLIKRGGPLIFFSSQASVDAENLKSMFPGTKIQANNSATDQLFNMVSLTRKGEPIALIVQEYFCHSYTVLKLYDGSEMRLATPDLYLHLYYNLMIFGKKEKEFFNTTLYCLIGKLHSVLKRSRNKGTSFLPSFSLRCSGTQKGLPTLLRERKERSSENANKKNNTRVKKVGGRRFTRRVEG